MLSSKNNEEDIPFSAVRYWRSYILLSEGTEYTTWRF